MSGGSIQRGLLALRRFCAAESQQHSKLARQMQERVSAVDDEYRPLWGLGFEPFCHFRGRNDDAYSLWRLQRQPEGATRAARFGDGVFQRRTPTQVDARHARSMNGRVLHARVMRRATVLLFVLELYIQVDPRGFSYEPFWSFRRKIVHILVLGNC